VGVSVAALALAAGCDPAADRGSPEPAPEAVIAR